MRNRFETACVVPDECDLVAPFGDAEPLALRLDDDDEPSEPVVSACATPLAVASAAPTPSVSAPALNQEYA
ncbi:hypothetical protein [Mycobacterium sp. RTGN5]|uniref:hypothetical protein n=1 Tax=Mycobacterium sp. RTGN5 TaxID=3016522 RepID=UPI0029C880F4|nr:hypothetical protein [Mycobacterium sp. RTGN5]